MCQSLESLQLSEVTAATELTAAVPIIVSPLRIYKFTDLITPFITMREHLDTFKTPSEAKYLYPILSRVLNEIRFLNIVGTYLTSFNVRVKIRE
jgi:hypothetical protein